MGSRNLSTIALTRLLGTIYGVKTQTQIVLAISRDNLFVLLIFVCIIFGQFLARDFRQSYLVPQIGILLPFAFSDRKILTFFNDLWCVGK